MTGKQSLSLVMGEVPSRVLKVGISRRLKPSLGFHEEFLGDHMPSEVLSQYLEVDHSLTGVYFNYRSSLPVPPSKFLIAYPLGLARSLGQ